MKCNLVKVNISTTSFQPHIMPLDFNPSERRVTLLRIYYYEFASLVNHCGFLLPAFVFTSCNVIRNHANHVKKDYKTSIKRM